MIDINNSQRSDEWYSARRGMITSSEVEKLMHDHKRAMTEHELADYKASNPKSRVTTVSEPFSDTSYTYLDGKIAERLMDEGQFQNYIDETRIGSRATEWGSMMEAVAREKYESVMGCKVETCDFIPCNDERLKGYCGGSPDGMVTGNDRIIEIKCPYTIEKHIKHYSYKTADDLKDNDPQYYWQCMMNMFITGKSECDFISYSPWFKDDMDISVLRLYRSKECDAELEKRLTLARQYIEESIKRLSVISSKKI